MQSFRFVGDFGELSFHLSKQTAWWYFCIFSSSFCRGSRAEAAQAQATLEEQVRGQNPDKHWEPRAQFTGLWDTEFFRRLLQKAEFVSGEHVVKSVKVYRVARRDDKLSRTLTLKDFRTIAAAAPSTLVYFDNEKDCLRFSLPAEPTHDFESCLLAHANISAAALRTLLSTETGKKKRKVS